MPRGVHKGKRGPKRSALPPELLEKLGPAPLGQPLKLARWFTDAIAILTQLVLEGKPFLTMLESVRASAGAAGRVIPTDILFESMRILSEDAKGAKAAHDVRAVKRSDVPVPGRSGAVRREA